MLLVNRLDQFFRVTECQGLGQLLRLKQVGLDNVESLPWNVELLCGRGFFKLGLLIL